MIAPTGENKRRPYAPVRRTMARVTVVSSAAIIIFATLWPQGSIDEAGALLSGDAGGRLNLADMVANIVLFAPFGFGLLLTVRNCATGPGRLRMRSPLPVTIIAALVLSTAIELAQLSGIVGGRHPSPVDVLCNTLGATFGAFIAGSRNALLHSSKRSATVFALTWTAFVIAFLACSGWMMSRSESEATAVTRSRLPFTTGFGWFEQSVDFGVVDDVAFTHSAGGALIVEASARRSHDVGVSVRGRDRRRSFVPILFVHDARDSLQHVTIGQKGDAFGLRVRTNAYSLGLVLPPLLVGDFPDAVGDTVGALHPFLPTTISATIRPDSWTLEARRGTRVVEIGYKVRPAGAWMLFVPLGNITGLFAMAGSLMLVAILFNPLAWWTTMALGGRLPALGLAAFTSAGLLLATAALFRLSYPVWQEWVITWLATSGTFLLARRQVARDALAISSIDGKAAAK